MKLAPAIGHPVLVHISIKSVFVIPIQGFRTSKPRSARRVTHVGPSGTKLIFLTCSVLNEQGSMYKTRFTGEEGRGERESCSTE